MTSDLIPQLNSTVRLIKSNTSNTYNTQYGQVKPEPIAVKALVPEDFLLYRGRPTVPVAWCRSRALISPTGQYLSDSRPVASQLGDLEGQMYTRFYASDQFYDSVTGTWRPSFSQGVDYFFTSPPGMSPSLEDIDYTKGKEIIHPNCLMFSYADYLKSSFDYGYDVATAGFTMYLVGLVQGTDTGCILAFDNGFEIAHNSSVFVTTDKKASDYFPSNVSIQQMKPFYLVLSVNQDKVTVYLSSGTGNLYSKATTVSDPTWGFNFMIGKSYGKNPGYAQISLMDFGIFDYPMTTGTPPKTTLLSSDIYMPPDDLVPLSKMPLTGVDPVTPDEGQPVDDTVGQTPVDHLDVSSLISSLSSVYGA